MPKPMVMDKELRILAKKKKSFGGAAYFCFHLCLHIYLECGKNMDFVVAAIDGIVVF